MADDKPIKRSVGHPRILDSPEQAWERGQAYFDQCDKDNEPYQVTGLALALGLCSRQSLCEYEARSEYTDVIKRLKARVEQYLVKRSMGNGNPAGAIFVLKNMGWSDRQDVALSTPNGPLESRIEIVLRKA